jgi:hypothetical protein
MFVARRKSLLSKARLVGCLVLGTVVLVPATATAKQPTPPTGGLDKVTATGGGGDYSNISVNASSGPSGEHPTGTASFTVRLVQVGGIVTVLNLGGPVTCLSVTGNTAVLNVDEQRLGVGILTLKLTDNGGNGLDVFNGGFTGRAPTDCSAYTSGTAAVLTNGRVRVFDAPPLPTTKEQCKNGGWSQYGFANKGQCMKFVNHP